MDRGRSPQVVSPDHAHKYLWSSPLRTPLECSTSSPSTASPTQWRSSGGALEEHTCLQFSRASCHKAWVLFQDCVGDSSTPRAEYWAHEQAPKSPITSKARHRVLTKTLNGLSRGKYQLLYKPWFLLRTCEENEFLNKCPKQIIAIYHKCASCS